jgi:hypothetical protein
MHTFIWWKVGLLSAILLEIGVVSIEECTQRKKPMELKDNRNFLFQVTIRAASTLPRQ